MKTIRVTTEYDIDVLIDYTTEELFNKEFDKLRKVIEDDPDKFIAISKDYDNARHNRNILYELVD